MKEPQIPLAKLLKQITSDPANRRKSGPACGACKEKLISVEIEKFYKMKRRNDPTARGVSWVTFCRLHLRGQMGWGGTYSALMSHVRNHLGEDG